MRIREGHSVRGRDRKKERRKEDIEETESGHKRGWEGWIKESN